jgi:hypothetical protein
MSWKPRWNVMDPNDPHSPVIIPAEDYTLVIKHLKREKQLALDILSLATDSGMPDTFFSTDQRTLRAQEVLSGN